ncbi:MAG: thioredoxin family protein [Deltaproteobacteria bacterium]|nr:thioredoxin family protein [Deltaproteobacteria bacterium]
MAVIDLSPDILESTLLENDYVLIDFWSPSCAPCRSFKPVFAKASEGHSEICFTSCNTQEQPELAQAFGIQSIPTLVVFREQVLILSQVGAMADAALETLINKIKSLNMDEVRARVAEQEKKLAQSEASKESDS